MDQNIETFLFEKLNRYADIPYEEISLLAHKVSLRYIGRNDFFLRQGDRTSELALIYSGLFRIYCINTTGDEKTLAFREGGQFLAGFSPFIENKEIWYSIQALENSEILCMNFDEYRELEKSHPGWNELIKNYITALFIEKENRERSLLLEDATTRYINFLYAYPGYEGRLSQYHIASYLGITPVSLSRIRSALKKI